jgi:hypothetical protein
MHSPRKLQRRVGCDAHPAQSEEGNRTELSLQKTMIARTALNGAARISVTGQMGDERCGRPELNVLLCRLFIRPTAAEMKPRYVRQSSSGQVRDC